jgi:SAM-dependent methyltransferase
MGIGSPTLATETSPEMSLPAAIGQKPSTYGAFWKEHDGGLDWYTWMYNSRIDQHQCFQQWFQYVNHLEPVQSVLEFGCGFAVGYADFFKDIHYIGTDIAETAITWCKKNRQNKKHHYYAVDFITEKFEEKFDVVFSQGTIDNTYDINGFIKSAMTASRRWIYVTAYRGFFPDLQEHRYSWNEKQGCYYNDISPSQVYTLLKAEGCLDIAVVPSHTGRQDIPFETLIIARVVHE